MLAQNLPHAIEKKPLLGLGQTMAHNKPLGSCVVQTAVVFFEHPIGAIAGAHQRT